MYEKRYEHEGLENELIEIEESIENLVTKREELLSDYNKEKIELMKLAELLEIIENDISNNKELEKIRKYGSNINSNIYKGYCPTCSQKIQDTLIISQKKSEVMTLNENIKHLVNQKRLLKASIEQKNKIMTLAKNNLNVLNNSLKDITNLYKRVKSDLFKISKECNESNVYKKIIMENKVDDIINAKREFESKTSDFKILARKYRLNRASYKELPKDSYSKLDLEKIAFFRYDFQKQFEGL